MFVGDLTSPRNQNTSQENSGGFEKQFLLVYRNSGKVISDRKYVIRRNDGSVIEGKTDNEGKTDIIVTQTAENIKIEIYEA